jgi:poly(A) polymerase Pap1
MSHEGHTFCLVAVRANLAGAKSLDLSYQVNEYKDMCHNWDKYNAELNFLSVQHVRKSVFLGSVSIPCANE